MMRLNRPFLLYADCLVRYDGRASSSLDRGNYLIVRKGDGSLMVHGASRLVPLNYQPAGAVMTGADDVLTSERRGETITITVHGVIFFMEMNSWSDLRTRMKMTENDLREQIVENVSQIVGEDVTEVFKEYRTPYGPVDLLVTAAGRDHVIEVKRGRATVSACTQLLRYLEYFKETGSDATGWLMAPEITDNARKYCEKHGLRWYGVRHKARRRKEDDMSLGTIVEQIRGADQHRIVQQDGKHLIEVLKGGQWTAVHSCSSRQVAEDVVRQASSKVILG